MSRPRRVVVLHVGAMKTGTSHLQSVLAGTKRREEAGGLRYVEGFARQTRAVQDVLRTRPGASPDDVAAGLRHWRALAAAMFAPEVGTAVVSMEFLSFATRRQARLLVDAVTEALPAGQELELHVVVTVRDQLSVVPAQWQTYTRNAGTDSWPEYLRHIEADAPEAARASRAHRTFHRAQDVSRIVERWSQPAVDRVTLVTVPTEGPRDQLWRRFCEATGIDPLLGSTEGTRDNDSLSFAASDWLRRLNHRLDLPPRQHRRLLRALAESVLVPMAAGGERPVLDRRAASHARERNRGLRELVASGAVALVGSAEDLPLPERLEEWPEVAPPPGDADRLAVAEAVLARLRHLTGVAADAPTGTTGTTGAVEERVERLVEASVPLVLRAHDQGLLAGPR